MNFAIKTCLGVLLLMLATTSTWAQEWQDATPRRQGQGDGPYQRLVIKGATVIRGNEIPASGPITIVIENNRIVGLADVPAAPGDHVIDARGMYVMPGLIDSHVRLIDAGYDALSPDYGLKLLLAHGVTTIASMQDFGHVDWALRMQKASRANTIVAPRIQVWSDVSGSTPEQVRANIRSAHRRGVFGVGEGSVYSGKVELMRAALDEARKLKMRSHWHMGTTYEMHFNALDAARLGMNGMAHSYGLTDALLDAPAVEEPGIGAPGDRRDSFANNGRVWRQTAPPHSPRWNKVLDEFRSLDFTFEPTFSVYEAHRDYMGTSRAEWHDDYLHPILEATFVPGKSGRFSHFYDWRSTNEVEWRENYRLWMTFINEYKNRGGRVVAGSDPGFMWVNFGFGLIRNLEMLQEAGFSIREALDAATVNSAQHMGMQDQVGTIEVGKLADLAILERDPTTDLKVFYGTGTLNAQADGTIKKTGGVKYTIKDGIVYDAKALLAEVADMVRDARAKRDAAR